MSRFYPSRNIALPVNSDGHLIKDANGVVIAVIANSLTAHAMVELMNLGAPIAEQTAVEHDQREAFLLRTLLIDEKKNKYIVVENPSTKIEHNFPIEDDE